MTSPVPSSSPAGPAPASRRRQRLVLSVVTLSAVLIWLDTTILGIALERLADPVRGLGADPGQLQWAVGAYSLLFATVLFPAGALGDRFGHRTILLAGISTFGAASLWAAWAPDATQLVLARGVMGAGGAMIMPASIAIITWTFPVERRAGAIGMWSAASGVGVALGPLLGGVLIDHFWWGSVFLVNAPIAVLGGVGMATLVPNPRSPVRRRPDPLGLVLSTTGLLALAYGLIEGGQASGWGSGRVLGPIVAGAVLLAAFVVAELRAPEPSFDPRLFRNARFAAGNVALGALFLGITGQMFYNNLYLQGVRGLTALQAALNLLPGALALIVGAPLGARLARRWGVAAVSCPGLVGFVLVAASMTRFGLHTPLLWFQAIGVVSGLAIGLCVAPVTAAVIAALPVERAGAGAAVNNAFRQVASLLGIAVLGTVLASTYRGRIGPSLAGLPAPSRDAARPSAEATRHVARVVGRPDLVDAADRAFVHAMHVSAVWTSAIVLAGAIALTAALARRSGATPPGPAPTPARLEPETSAAAAPESARTG